MSEDGEDAEVKRQVEERVIRHIVDVKNANKEIDSKIAKFDALEQEALDAYQRAKDQLMEDHPDFSEEIQNISSGTELDNLSAVLEKLSDRPQSSERPKYSGKVSGRKPVDQGGDSLRTKRFENHQEMIDALVTAKERGNFELRNPNPRAEVVAEGEEASKMLNELWRASYDSGKKTTLVRRTVMEDTDHTGSVNYVRDIRDYPTIHR